MDKIYADNAATTKLDPLALKEMIPFLTDRHGNPSALNAPGRLARRALNDARKELAALLHAEPEELYFTAGGTESDNWAIKGIAIGRKRQSGHIITTAIEHHAILHSCRAVEKEGFRITVLPVDGYGRVDPDDVRGAICQDTALISVMSANNEVGTVQPVSEISAIAREYGVAFHTDAVQAAPYLPLDLQRLGVDMLSLSAHKFHGPKGVGLLYVRKGTELSNLMDGGAQENLHRAGTENVPGIVGMQVAYRDIRTEQNAHNQKLERLCLDTWDRLRSIPGIRRNGDPKHHIPGLMSLTIPGLEAKAALVYLNAQGIYISAGAACTAGQNGPSHVLTAMGISKQDAGCTLRISYGADNKTADAARVAEALLSCARIAGVIP